MTLGEMKSLEGPAYLFVFENRGTNEMVSWVEQASGDVSAYPDRYNKFAIDVDAKFPGATLGTWLYRVYEQESLVNTDPDLATGLLEAGLAVLSPATRTAAGKYTGANNTYKAYSQ